MTEDDILNAIELKIGWHLPRCSVEQGLPLLDKRPDRVSRVDQRQGEQELEFPDELFVRRSTSKDATALPPTLYHSQVSPQLILLARSSMRQGTFLVYHSPLLTCIKSLKRSGNSSISRC